MALLHIISKIQLEPRVLHGIVVIALRMRRYQYWSK